MSELTSDQRQQIMAALAANSKLQAVKLYREFTGSGLQTAKEFIEQLQVALQTGETPESSSDHAAEVSAEIHQQVLGLLKSGQKIQAIKVYKTETKCDLRTAKEAVEAIASQNGIQPAKSGCGATVLALCVGLIAFAILFS